VPLMTSEITLKGKAIVISGASRGIGEAIARAAATVGANVVLAARKQEGLDTVAASIGEQGGSALAVACHMGHPDEVTNLFAKAKDTYGAVHGLVNNAATNPYAGPTIDVDMPRWEKTLQINLTAPLLWTQLAWQRALKEGGGAVINVSSVGGFTTNQILGVYDVTKAALIRLTKQLAAELGPGVRVNAVAPGLIKTDFARTLWEEGRGDVVAKAHPLKRLGEPEDVAAAALYLAVDAGWVTGHTIVLDGGGLSSFNRIR